MRKLQASHVDPAEPSLAAGCTASEEERRVLFELGDVGAARALRMPKTTIARLCAGWPVRPGTLALLRERLRAWRELPAAKGVGVG